MSIEAFMRGCFDVGLDVRVRLDVHGQWMVRAYDHVSPQSHRYRHGEGATFAEALQSYNDAEWKFGLSKSIRQASEALDEVGRMLGTPDERYW